MVKQTSTRKRKSLAEIQAFLAKDTPPVRAITLKLRRLVFDVIPTALEQIDEPAHLLGYGFDQTYKDTLCVIMPVKTYVNLGFARGASLPDPAGLLVGAGKRARHVKVTERTAVDAPALRALLKATVDQWRANQSA